jgi:FtsP/CotA-like multicopper oxidase with cupredoxin domain
LVITLTNDLPQPAGPSATAMKGMEGMTMSPVIVSGLASSNCGNMIMTAASVNIHYHGTNTPPLCHQDEVIKTLINAGESFTYDLHFPFDEPPGLYWYHPHIHGISEAAVQGGASGAIVVEGLETVNPEVAGLPERVVIVRDNNVPGAPTAGNVPAWDLSVNYSPVPFPSYTPVVAAVKPKEKQLWRVLNACADTILDIQLNYDGVPQPLSIVGIDGVPTGSEDGTATGKTLTRTHFLLAPAARVEFVLTAPDPGVKKAILLTRNIDTGPDGDNDPERSLVSIVISAAAPEPPVILPPASAPTVAKLRFDGLATAPVSVKRKLYFSEVLSDPTNPNSPTNFYITVAGATPTLFNPNNPPAIVTTQGSVEEWTIENRAMENHEFHIHQIHFLAVGEDGKPIDGQYRDLINVPYWSGTGPYPSVTLRMDFRGPDVGDFVYHCHILGHEDSGMMAIIRVLPKP